jgi:hypothetical protein
METKIPLLHVELQVSYEFFLKLNSSTIERANLALTYFSANARANILAQIPRENTFAPKIILALKVLCALYLWR